jgi:hypothetical protein
MQEIRDRNFERCAWADLEIAHRPQASVRHGLAHQAASESDATSESESENLEDLQMMLCGVRSFGSEGGAPPLSLSVFPSLGEVPAN